MSQTLFREFVDVVYEGNQARAAEALDVDKSTVSRICGGTRGITPEMALQVERLSGGRYRKESLVWPDDEAEQKQVA